MISSASAVPGSNRLFLGGHGEALTHGQPLWRKLADAIRELRALSLSAPGDGELMGFEDEDEDEVADAEKMGSCRTGDDGITGPVREPFRGRVPGVDREPEVGSRLLVQIGDAFRVSKSTMFRMRRDRAVLHQGAAFNLGVGMKNNRGQRELSDG